jgi:hypothetical protein
VYEARVLEYSSTIIILVLVLQYCNTLCADCGIPGHGRDGVTPDPSGGQVWQ